MQVSSHSAVTSFCGRPQWCGSTDSKGGVGHKARALMQEAQDAGLDVSRKTFGFMASSLAKGIDKAEILAQLGAEPVPEGPEAPEGEDDGITVGDPVEVDVPPMNVTPEAGAPEPGGATAETAAQFFATAVSHTENLSVSAAAADAGTRGGAAYSASLSIITLDASMSGQTALDLLLGADEVA